MRETFKFMGLTAAIVIFTAAVASAQSDGAVSANQPKPVADAKAARAIATPAMTEFRKASIGTLGEDLKEAWGKPQVEDKDGFLYEFDDNQMAQIVIDGDKKVSAIAVTFRDGTGAPKAEEVFGPNEKIEPKADGTVFHMVRYPEAGYWVSYSSQGKGKPVILMYQKL